MTNAGLLSEFSAFDGFTVYKFKDSKLLQDICVLGMLMLFLLNGGVEIEVYVHICSSFYS